MNVGRQQPWDSAAAVEIGAGRLVEWAGRVAGMVGPRWVSEAHAVEVLADAAGCDPAVLRDAVVQA